MLHGFDVSGYNPNTVRKCNFVFVKASEGKSYRSGSFTAQWASAHANADWRGGYHYAHPEESSAENQADRFMDIVEPEPGEGLCLDLEASKLTQGQTNTWARKFGDRLRDKAPGVTTVAYFGSGYAANGTGKGLVDHFDRWWYAQYPSAYQLVPGGRSHEEQRAINRSHETDERRLLSAGTSKWPPSVSPWLPSGLTCGWAKPDLWQFTDNWQGWDASVTALTLDQLAASGGGQPQQQEEDMPYGGQLQPGAGTKANISFPKGSMGAIGLVYDSPNVAEVRVAFHHKTAGGGEVYTLKVGGPKSATDAWPAKTVQSFKTVADGDWVSLTRLDSGTDPVGWDMS